MKKLFLMAAIMLALPMMAQNEEEVWHYTHDWIPSWYSTPINLDDIKAASTPKNNGFPCHRACNNDRLHDC